MQTTLPLKMQATVTGKKSRNLTTRPQWLNPEAQHWPTDSGHESLHYISITLTCFRVFRTFIICDGWIGQFGLICFCSLYSSLYNFFLRKVPKWQMSSFFTCLKINFSLVIFQIIFLRVIAMLLFPENLFSDGLEIIDIQNGSLYK